MRKIQLAAITAATMMAGAWTASATLVSISTSQPAGWNTSSGSAFQTKYKLDSSNWDQSLANQSATDYGTMVNNNLGNNSQLNGTPFDFNVAHYAGQGFVYTIVNNNTLASSTLAWGLGANIPPVPTGKNLNSLTAPAASFNALKFTVSAAINGTVTSDTISVNNIVFSSPSLSVLGSFAPISALAPPTSSALEYLTSDVDLSLYDWTITGTVVASFLPLSSGQNLSERLKFTIDGGNFAPVPEPSTYVAGALLLLPFGASTLRMLRKCRKA